MPRLRGGGAAGVPPLSDHQQSVNQPPRLLHTVFTEQTLRAVRSVTLRPAAFPAIAIPARAAMDLQTTIPPHHPYNDPSAWAQLCDVTITSREVHLEQLQLFVTGALRHPALVSKDCACMLSPPPHPSFPPFHST